MLKRFLEIYFKGDGEARAEEIANQYIKNDWWIDMPASTLEKVLIELIGDADLEVR